MDKTNVFRKNLVKRRKELGLTQEQLARRLNVSSQAVSKWENSSYPDADLLPLLAKALGTSLDALFGISTADTEADYEKIVFDIFHNAVPESRPELMMRLVNSIISAYSSSNDEPKKLHHSFDSETFSGCKTDYEITLARLNTDLRYFFYIEKPENGVNSYLTNTKNMVRLLKTLADEDAIRIISCLASGVRNRLFSVKTISKRLGIDHDKVQSIIDRLDRFGLVWRMAADTDEGSEIVYGYTHSPPITMILILSQTITNYLSSWDTCVDSYSKGVFIDDSGYHNTPVPQVSWWDEND